MRAYAGADGDMEKTRKQIEAWEKQNETPQGQRTLRAMNETNLAEGGAFVQQQFSGEYIQLLRPKAIVRASGARVIQMPAGNLSMGKITSGASSYWRGEGQSATSSQLGTGSLNLQSKELVTQVPISKKLLKHAALSFDMIVRDDAVQSGSVAEDSAFIRSEGTEYRPTGLRYLVSDDNIIQPDGATLAFVESTRSKARLKLKNANIPMTKPTWLMSYRTEEFLLSMRDGNGNVAFPEMVSGKWGVFPYFASNQIPDDLGTGGDESEIYLYDAFEVFIADDGAVAVDVQDKVSYRDADGNLQSAFDRGETVVQVVQSMDFDTRYKNAVVVINQVTWGA
jgi:HK97 family phage major capsid protein